MSPGQITFSEISSKARKQKQPAKQAFMGQAVAIHLYSVPIYQGFSTCNTNKSNVDYIQKGQRKSDRETDSADRVHLQRIN